MFIIVINGVLDNKVIVFTEIQCYWIEYKNEYKKYRFVGTKEERKSIKGKNRPN